MLLTKKTFNENLIELSDKAYSGLIDAFEALRGKQETAIISTNNPSNESYLRLFIDDYYVRNLSLRGVSFNFGKASMGTLLSSHPSLGVYEVLRAGFSENLEGENAAYIDVIPTEIFLDPSKYFKTEKDELVDENKILSAILEDKDLMVQFSSACGITEVRTSTGYVADLAPKPIQKYNLNF